MRIGDCQQPDGIFFPGHHPDNALAAAVLRFINMRRHAFDKPAVAENHGHFLMRNQVFLAEFFNPLFVNLRAALIPEFIFQVVSFLFNQGQNPAGITQQVFQIRDCL